MAAQRNPIEAEKTLFEAVKTGNAAAVERTLADMGRDSIEFTGRCFSFSIAQGDVDVALLLGRNGFCLNVLDEPAVKNHLATGDAGTRGLVGFMQRYRYCRAQRTYYLPVVQSQRSLQPIEALLSQQEGLTARDQSELLSLAVRQDNIALARVLVQGGAQLIDDIHESVPDDLKGKAGVSAQYGPWIELLSPRCSMDAIRFILEQTGSALCPIHADWFKLYFRDPLFAAKLALIAPRSSARHCEDTCALLTVLAREGFASAVASMLAWEGLDRGALAPALAAAREQGRVEIVAQLLAAQGEAPLGVQPLEF